MSLLDELLTLQAEIRAMENDELAARSQEVEPGVFHLGYEGDDFLSTGGQYEMTSPASIPAGTEMVASSGDGPGEERFADFARNAEGEPVFTVSKCANNPNCLDDNFCFSWFDCGECEWCEGNTCVDRDPNRTCAADWECPCPPTEGQRYDCINGTCKLTCNDNSDCGDCEVCDLETRYCGPGCTENDHCDPNSAEAVGDAQTGALCVNCECKTPCEPPTFCDPLNDQCPFGEYCEERRGRAPGDPEGPSSAYVCVDGCKDDSECEPIVREDGSITREYCVNHECKRLCSSNSDCDEAWDEGCVEGECRDIGAICLASTDCSQGEYCNSDGRCESGCAVYEDCHIPCGKDPSCVSQCPADPTCECTENCNGLDWLENCPRDPSCVQRCPTDAGCLADYEPDAVCVDNACIVPCTNEAACRPGYACTDGKCVNATPGNSEKRTVCKVEQFCGEVVDDQGNPTGEQLCVDEEVCTEEEIEIPVTDSLAGCGCGELCTQYGQCQPGICSTDADCEDCSYCYHGTCVPGCDDENPCGEGECCQAADGKCHLQCTQDDDCPDPEMCLAGGCCGIACDAVIYCSATSGCPEGQYCDGAGVCQQGCREDSDCDATEICFQFQCEPACVADGDCDEDEVCNNYGFCEAAPKPSCSTDNDCDPDYICKNTECTRGCRTDDQCEGEQVCKDNRCAFICSTSQECVANGIGDLCTNGTCSYAGESLQGRTGCECYEECDTLGRCERTVCLTDNDCNCGSCLTDGKCGECESDRECPGSTVCDNGTCTLPCVPEKPCTGHDECSTAMT